MRKFYRLFGTFALAALLCACGGGTEIDNNPAPIAWGQLTFSPSSVEKSRSATVWNNVQVTSPGATGTIAKVTITDKETVVENIDLNGMYSAQKQIWRGASGDYKQALELFLSGKMPDGDDFDEMLANLPKFKIASYEGTGEKLVQGRTTVSVASSKLQNLSFFAFENLESSNLLFATSEPPEVSIGKISVKKFALTGDIEADPAALTLEGWTAENMAASGDGVEIKIGKGNLNYKYPKANFGLEQVSIPGKVFEDLHIPNLPATINGSLAAEGEIKGTQYDASGALDIKDFFALKASVEGQVAAEIPHKVEFQLADTGLVKFLPADVKQQIQMLSVFITPNPAPISTFLGEPGKTLLGTIVMQGMNPQVQFSVK